MIKKLTALLVGAAATLAATAADIAPEVRTGTLPNGMTYYIQHNANPAGTADYFLAQRVGSINEDENQRGLAHFLEHMCFNGTEHFPGNSLITYLESIGVKFGAHLNAYTSTDETVYNICKAPSTRPSTIDSCLMIIRDWCGALRLDTDDINAERGVIVNEWRQRNSPSNRMLEKASPMLYGGSSYGERLPIGLMSVVENFDPETLRSFYKKWYIPANQAVIVVGDIDVDKVEKSVRRLFSTLPKRRSSDSQAVSIVPVPVADSLVTVAVTDPEQGVEMLQLYFRTPDYKGRKAAAADMLAGMLARRFDSLELSDDCPHTSLALGPTKYLLARNEKCFTLRGPVRPGRSSDATAAWIGEIARAKQHGFSAAELDEARKEALAGARKQAKAHSNPDNSYLARLCVRHYLDGGDVKTAEQTLADKIADIEGVTVDDITACLADLDTDTGHGAVILSYAPSGAAPGEELTKAFRGAASRSYAPYTATQVTKTLMDHEPVAGTIVATDSLPLFDTKIYTLSNGIKVAAKRTAFKEDQIYVRAYSPGGISQFYDGTSLPTLRVLNELMAEMPVGGHTAADLRRILGDRNVKVSVSVSNNEEGFEASTDRQGLADAFRLMHLRTTAFAADSAAFRSFAAARRNAAARRHPSPVQAMGDSIHYIIYSRHPLAAHPGLADIDSIDMNQAIDIYKERFADMSDFTMMVVGDFDTDSLESYLCRYVASLPGGGRKESARSIGYRFTPADVDVRFSRPMENAQGIVYNIYTAPVDYNVANLLNASAFGQVLRSRLLAELREKRGLCYSVKARCNINPGVDPSDGPQMMMPIYIKVSPGSEDECAREVAATIEALCKASNIEKSEIDAIRSYMTKNHAEAATDNAYWLRILKSYLTDGLDLDSSYDAAVEALTPESVAAFGREAVGKSNKSSLIMTAE